MSTAQVEKLLIVVIAILLALTCVAGATLYVGQERKSQVESDIADLKQFKAAQIKKNALWDVFVIDRLSKDAPELAEAWRKAVAAAEEKPK